MAKLMQQLLDEQKEAASASGEQASQAALEAVQQAETLAPPSSFPSQPHTSIPSHSQNPNTRKSSSHRIDSDSLLVAGCLNFSLAHHIASMWI